MRIGEQTGNVFMTEAQNTGVSPIATKLQNTSIQENRNSVDI